MDSFVLRIILLIAGAIFLAAIYFWETAYRKRRAANQAKPRKAPEFSQEGTGSRQDEDDDVMFDLDRLADDLPEINIDDHLDTHSPDDRLTNFDLPKQREMFKISAKDASPVDVPSMIIQINLVAKEGVFGGLQIQQAMEQSGLEVGDMQIYHRYSDDGKKQVVFSLASMVEPGVFPLDGMAKFTTPGLTMFAQLPGPGDGLSIFADMLFTAERLATSLKARLQDDSHSTLTKQTIENIRSQILEHRRKIQLARSKR